MQITFQKENHIYRDEKGIRYSSVSSVIEKFQKPFDENIISRAVARRDGRTQAEILAEWKRKKDISLLLGNYIHDSLDIGLKYPESVQNCDMLGVIDQIKQILPKDHKWLQERILADTENKIAGTADLITLKDKQAIIWDHKTNELDKPAYNKFLPPLGHLEDNKMNRYGLQMSFYKRMVELQGIKVIGLKIINILNGKVEIIEVSPLDDEVKKMVEFKDKTLPSDIIIKL